MDSEQSCVSHRDMSLYFRYYLRATAFYPWTTRMSFARMVDEFIVNGMKCIVESSFRGTVLDCTPLIILRDFTTVLLL